MVPHLAEFDVTRTMGEKRTEKVFDATASLALTRFTAAFTSMVTPEGQKWHSLSTSSKELNKNVRVRRYFDDVTDILFRNRYRGGFGAAIQECYTSLGAFGTTAMLVEPSRNGGVYYKAMPLHRYWLDEDAEGRVDTYYRYFKLSARQVAQKPGWRIPKVIQEALENNQEDKEFEFIQCVMPNNEIQRGRLDYRGMKYASYYVCLEDKEDFVSVGGYHSFPAPASRFMTVPGEPYGYSPAMTILADGKMLNEMEKTRIKAAHLLTSPPWLLNDDLMGNPINFKPDALNYGGLNSSGQQMIQPMVTGGNPNIALELTDQKRKVINDAFFVTLFQILVEGHTMSATEVLERAREKGALLSPTFSRQNSEFISRIVEREIDVHARVGALPEMPPELLEAQGEFDVIFENPLARAQKQEPVAALARNLEVMTPIANIAPEVLMNYDFDAISRDLPEMIGIPAAWVRTQEKVDEMRQQQQMAQQQRQMMESADVLARIQKTEAQAQAIAQAGEAGRV